ncbi:MAG: sensor histidine kinase [Calditrichaeota bacterium]|nr:MAG: sensor histidine kinase [Calditrichota bacterium]MBL1207940.1 sensor histidine kinase [Calditrichota bacterium]NOG47776.1 HAMP domain-containing histidine kinase [Calditrichota bacterium]
MKYFKNTSLKIRILITFTAITILLVAIMARVSYESVKENYLQQAGEHVKMLSTYMAKSLDVKYLDFISSSKNNLADEVYHKFLVGHVQKSGVENAFIFDKSLALLATAKAGISSSQLKLNQNEILLVSPGASGVSVPFSNKEGHWFIWGFYRIDDNFYLGIEENASRLETLNQLSRIFFGIGLAGIILTIIAGWFIARSIAEPVDKLVDYSKEIGAGNFKAVPPKKINGEFSILNKSMQQMQNDLETQNKEREQMLAQIAHEIRNPLGGIELLSGLVKENLSNDDPSQMHLKKIIEEVHGLKEQLNLFLEYSKPQKVDKENVNLNILAKEVEDNFLAELKQKNIEFRIENQLETISFDRGHLKQTLVNLVSNSIDAVDNNGQIVFSSIRQNGSSMLQIKDNGSGIDEQKMKDIFRPFYTSKANGTGLGLAICRKLCLANNAELLMKNNDSKGCSFFLWVKN